MAIVFRGSSIKVLSASGASIAPVVPANVVAGDLLLIFVGCGNASITYSSSSGGTWNTTTATTGTSYSQQLLYRTATASDANSTITVTGSASHLHGGILVAYGNVAGFDPAAAAGAETSSSLTTASAPSVTPLNAGDTLVWFGAATQISATGAPTIGKPTSPGTWSQEGTVTSSSGPGTSTAYITFTFADTTLAASGATGAVTGAIGSTTPVTTGGQMVSLQPSLGSADPARALPPPAWRGFFGKYSAEEQPAVLYDFYLQFSGAFVSAGDIAFGAVTLGSAQIFGPPQRALPSPAFRGQFGRFAAKAQPSVLYDVWLQFSGSYLTAGDIAFGANTTGTVNIPLTDPQRALPGPAFRGQFSKSAAKEQPSVPYDVWLQFSGSYSSAGDIAFSAVTTGSAQIIISGPAQSFDPSPVWRNIFQINDRSKESVLYDVWLQFSSATSGTISFGAITVGSVTATAINDPQSAFPGPAWLNQFRGFLGKSAILWDSQPPVLGLFCFTGSTEIDPNASLGGTAVLASLDATDGGSVNDNNQLAGTILDANGGLGGTATDVAVNYGGSETDANLYGGFLFGGCYD